MVGRIEPMADGRPGGMIRASPKPPLRLEIVPGGGRDQYDARLIGPQGWWTLESGVPFSQAHHVVWAVWNVTRLPAFNGETPLLPGA